MNLIHGLAFKVFPYACLTVFTVNIRDLESKTPKCDYCDLPLENVKYSR